MRYLIALISLLPALGWAQTDNEYLDSVESETRYVIGFVPSKANVINGWAIGYGFTLSAPDSSARTINGVYTNLQPFNTVVFAMAAPLMLFSSFSLLPNSSKISDTSKTQSLIENITLKNTLNGVAIHAFGIGISHEYVTIGAEICPGFIAGGQLKGFSLSLAAEYKDVSGCMISGLNNYTERGMGVQIALINVAENFTGVQIGLLNRIGNRVFPFVNFSFKRPQKLK